MLVTAFGVFWMTQYLEDALPFELIEAARVDGCNLLQTYWNVALPASRGAGAMLFLFTFVGSWTNFFWPFIVRSEEHTSELQSRGHLVCRLLLEKKQTQATMYP